MYVTVDLVKPSLGRIRLRTFLPRIVLTVEELALQIAQVNVIAIDQPEPADTRTRENFRRQTAQSATTDNADCGSRDPFWAATLPARRASRIDPAIALRNE